MKRKKTLLAVAQAKLLFVVLVLWLVGSLVALAQAPLSNLVFAVGTTIQAGNGQNWSYLVIGSEAPALLAGKQFAVYGKTGYATNAGTFSLRGKIFQQTSTTTIGTLLDQSVVLRDDLTSLSNAMNVVLRKISGASSQTLPQNLATAFQLSASDPGMSSTLNLLGRIHPGVLLCNGQAFSEVISTVTTYEIREVNPADGSAGDVIGRLTVVPGIPVVLPAPGFPFQLQSAGMSFRDGTNNPAERIKIYLRWGTPPELRRLALLNFGFNVWRTTKDTAEQNNFNVTPPMLAQLYTNAILANDAPVMATKDFAANAPGDPTDASTFFFVDDNGRKFGMPMFVDGAQYYYFITARDLLGRDGLVSAGTLATACRHLPPDAPTGLKVKNILQAVTVNGVPTNQPRLQLSWTQNTATNDNVQQYWIYRWDNPSAAMTNDATPLNHRIGVAAQLDGTNLNVFVDSGTNLPTAPSVSNYWFTVRAMSQSTCGPLLSPHSAPAWGVLREREGPPAASGEVLGSCGTPAVMFQNFNTLSNPANTNGETWSYRLTCQRRDPAVAWVQFSLVSDTASNSIGPVEFPPDGDTVSVDVSVPVGNNAVVPVVCTVGDYADNVSQPAINYFTTAVASGMQQEIVFYSGEMLLTALNSADPLLHALNGNIDTCTQASQVTPYADGTVGLQFNNDGYLGYPRMIEVLSNSVWADVGVAWPDTNNTYWVSYPSCLLGPMQTYRGCVINLPNSGGCDQHITRGAGNGVVAPIIVRFRPTLRSREYRLYRRTDDGPPSLVAQGNTTFDAANSSRSIVIPDDTMPPSAAHLCYYVQMLDEHGNGSPLALLGCEYAKPATLPRPVLAELKATGDTNHPQVLMNWFCPVAGVHRFEIKIHRDDQTSSGQPSGLSGSKLFRLLSYNPKTSFAGLLANRLRFLTFDEAQLTPPIGPDFGPGPQFSLTADVVAGGTYTITVAAVDDRDKAYADSEPQTFTWRQINTNIQTVPWPARPLPSVTHFDDDNGSTNYRVAATILRDPNHGLDTRYPVGIRIGFLTGLTNSLNINGAVTNFVTIGSTNFFQFVANGFAATATSPNPQDDPGQLAFRRNSATPDRNGEPLLPIVVYRQQTTNALFPKVSGALLQVTPEIEHIPFTFLSFPVSSVKKYGNLVIVPDLLIAAGVEYIYQPSGNYTALYSLYLRDQQPVMIGATYHYYVVRFNAKHEVAETIDAGTVTIPPN
jgi:hypothetical protein